MEKIQVNSVVQVNENGSKEWMGCLIQVTELKSWGVMGYTKIPFKGEAYMRLRFEEIDYIGQAVMVQQENNE